jgi:polyphosphate kinase
VRKRVEAAVAEHARIAAEVRGLLAEEGVSVLDYADVPEQHARLRQRFEEEIFPVLTPLAVDPGHPFPYISTLTLSLAIGIRDPETGERRFARVKVPPALPRLVAIGPSAFVLVEQIIAANLDLLFPGMEIEETHLFRVTRDADFEIEEDEASDLLDLHPGARLSDSRWSGRCRPRRARRSSRGSGSRRRPATRSPGCSI